MEAHPVPQNVTSFEFHLVGDMTIKQFSYLATGLGVSYLIFLSLAVRFPLIAWPLIVLFSLSGIAFAFLPIEDRPLDHWVAAFIKAVLTPTQRVWQSSISQDIPQELLQNRLNVYLNYLNNQPFPQKVSENPTNLSSVTQAQPVQNAPLKPPLPKPAPQPSQQPEPAKPLPTPQELEKTVELAKEAQQIQTRILETEKKLNEIKVRAAAPGADPKEFAEEFQKVLLELQGLSSQASTISHELAVISKTPSVGSAKKVVVAKKQTNLVLTSVGNIINGIVTDSANNYLEGVIVVTHNKEGLPVRALKTNKLGQFVAATPLPNGAYVLVLEKDNLSFDSVAVELDGKVLPPILISAKKGGEVIA